ncbi:Hsp20/alpha crystallin family protein [Haloferula sp.]|uniref:Hsp20/alpha crystallin family protein n=1 Tax=Haloferula sp. TaxID=2497595 RepID=UPI00329BE254
MILPQHLRNSSPWLSDFGRLFDTAFQRVSQGPRGLRVHEHEDNWTLEADFPGKPKEALELEVRDGALHLGIKSEGEVADSYRLPLGKHIDPTGITASLELGVLTVALPKAKAANESHRIEIN